MIYENAVEQVKGVRQQPVIPFRLAKVTSISNGRAYVQFYGESSASTKLYPYLTGYKPTLGDDVLMIQQANTFIIAGKISKDNIVDNYYLLKSAADALYLTEAAADEKYQPKGSSDYPAKIQNNNYWFGFNSTTAKAVYGYHRTSSSPDPIDLGSTSNKIGAVYADTVGGNSATNAIQTLNVRNATIYGTSVAVNTNNSVNMGASGKQFNNVYAKQFYQNGTAISTSDRRKKTGIKEIGRKYIEFFKKLKPRLFRFKDGESGRLHSGFVAQEVEEAAVETGIPNKDLAFLCIDENGDYGLRYEELIAIQTKVIQELLERVDGLEKRVGDLEKIIKGGKG